MIFAAWYNSTGMILLWVILACGLICFLAWMIRRYIKQHSTQEEKPKDPKELADEELKRILKPVDDEETKKQMDEYKEDDK